MKIFLTPGMIEAGAKQLFESDGWALWEEALPADQQRYRESVTEVLKAAFLADGWKTRLNDEADQ